MFLLKKIISAFLYPLPVCLGFLFVGLLFLWFTRKQWAGKVLVTLGALLLALLSSANIADRILSPLEETCLPLRQAGKLPGVKWIVVLGGGHSSDMRLHANAQLSRASLGRLVEAIRIHRELPEAKIIVSAGRRDHVEPGSEVMTKAAKSLGVDEKDLILESTSLDTEDQAMEIKKIVGHDKFILVTSAGHVPRSVFLFEKYGMHPIPAPTDYLAHNHPDKGKNLERFFPSIDNLYKTKSAFHEYFGLLWLRIKGFLGIFPKPVSMKGTE